MFVEIGDELLSKTYVDVDAMKEAAVKEALAIAERRHVRELRTALKKQHKELEDDKTKSMEKQKQVKVISKKFMKIFRTFSVVNYFWGLNSFYCTDI